MEEENLYQNVKRKICRQIFEDVYQDGDMIPSERKLSEDLGVSRVTIRKALKLLEEENIIERLQGSGTRVSLHYGSHPGNMDIITLVAPAQNAFFSRFIDAFQVTADEHDSLVLFKQKPRNMSLEKCLFQIYEKNLKNVVLWMEDMPLKKDALRKLRGLGMNIVLFDTTSRGAYADAVCLNNKDAIERLYHKLQEEGCKNIGFVGWDEYSVKSVNVREIEYQKKAEDNKRICRVSWSYRNKLEELPGFEVEKGIKDLSNCDGILYSVAELGIPFERKARELGIKHKAAMIDVLPGAEELEIITLEQDFQKMSEQIFRCLMKQNTRENVWEAKTYQVKGKLT